MDGAFDWVLSPSRAVPSLSLHAAWHRHAVVKALQPSSAPVETRDGEWGCGRRVGRVAFLNRWDRTEEETGSHGKRLETAIVDTFLSHPQSLRAPNFATDGKVRAHRREAAVPRGGQEMPDNTTARLTRRGAARNPVRTRMPLGPQPCSTVRGSGEQCWLCACVNVCVRVCARVQAAARGLDPGSPAVPVPPLPPDPLTATSQSGKRCPGPSSVRQGWGGCFRGGPARPYPRLASPSR